MKIILQQEVANLGQVGDQVIVKPGYGRNYLIPKGKALLATKQNLEIFEVQRAGLERKAQNQLDTAKKRAEQLGDKQVNISAKTGEGGKLFGSIGPRDIVIAIHDMGIEI